MYQMYLLVSAKDTDRNTKHCSYITIFPMVGGMRGPFECSILSVMVKCYQDYMEGLW